MRKEHVHSWVNQEYGIRGGFCEICLMNRIDYNNLMNSSQTPNITSSEASAIAGGENKIEEITPEEIDTIRNIDREYSENTDWPWDGTNLPSRVDSLLYIIRGDKEKAYARMLIHLRTGKYCPPEDLKFNEEKRVYYFNY